MEAQTTNIPPQKPSPQTKSEEKKRRMAHALRENLRKRKEQMMLRKEQKLNK